MSAIKQRFVTSALPGFCVAEFIPGDAERGPEIFLEPIVTWVTEIEETEKYATSKDYFLMATYPVCYGMLTDSTVSYVIYSPDGKYCFSGDCTVNSKEEAILVFIEREKIKQEIQQRLRDKQLLKGYKKS
jgi:hypothetical protein